MVCSGESKRDLSRIKTWVALGKGKVSKQPPKYGRMVAWDGQRNARDAVTVRVGQLDVIKGNVQAVDMSGVLINCLCISRVPNGEACFDGFYLGRAAPVSHVRHG
jgi:hypothetical protein